MNVNFIIYDSSGKITSVGNERVDHVQSRIDGGENVIITEQFVNLQNSKVDLDNFTIVPIETDGPNFTVVNTI